MRILVFSDVHLDAVTVGVARHDEIASLMELVADVAIRERVDRVLFLGDLCDPEDGPAAILAGKQAIHMWQRLAVAGIESRWLTGNHDVVDDGRKTTTLDGLQEASRGDVVKGPRFEHLPQDVSICFLPYVERAASYDPVNEVRSFAADNPLSVCVVAGHLNLEGIAPGSETEDMPRGRDVFFPFRETRALLGDRKLLMLNGHYHRRGIYEGVHIPGSLARLRFDEETNDPGYLLIDTEKLPSR